MSAMSRHGDRDLSDERILGNGDFVEKIIKEADDLKKNSYRKTANKK